VGKPSYIYVMFKDVKRVIVERNSVFKQCRKDFTGSSCIKINIYERSTLERNSVDVRNPLYVINVENQIVPQVP
jgi:hypothetical protein